MKHRSITSIQVSKATYRCALTSFFLLTKWPLPHSFDHRVRLKLPEYSQPWVETTLKIFRWLFGKSLKGKFFIQILAKNWSLKTYLLVESSGIQIDRPRFFPSKTGRFQSEGGRRMVAAAIFIRISFPLGRQRFAPAKQGEPALKVRFREPK